MWPLKEIVMWVVTREHNLYDQEGEYFVVAFDNKPTFQELKKLIGGSDVTIGKLTRGGGRQEFEEVWYNLYEVSSGQLFD
jgi:hypothetical protein